MENETRVQARGCIQLGDLLIFAFGAFMMFAKTANLLGKFAPDDWMGLAPSDYGFAAALLIEGFLVWRKVKMWLIPPKNLVEWATDILTTFVPFGLSLVAQVLDGYVTTGLINDMSQDEKTKITMVVSLLIGIPILLDLGKTAIENAPVGIFDNIKTKDAGVLGALLSRVGEWFGRGNTQPSAVTLNQDTPEVKQKPSSSKNVKKSEPEANPTGGERR